MRLECLQNVSSVQDVNNIGIGTACAADPEVCGRAQLPPDLFKMPLVCDTSSTNTCQAPCGNDSDCPKGYACFDGDGDEGPLLSLCVNPTCN